MNGNNTVGFQQECKVEPAFGEQSLEGLNRSSYSWLGGIVKIAARMRVAILIDLVRCCTLVGRYRLLQSVECRWLLQPQPSAYLPVMWLSHADVRCHLAHFLHFLAI